MPTVSVILPTHNRCTSLKRAIAGVLEQTFQDFEIIVVDDGSTDRTAEYLSTIEDPRIFPVTLSGNRGGACARNEGLKRAKGDYAAFLDDDDFWEPPKLERQLVAVSRPGAGLCHTGINCYARDEKFIKYVFMYPRFDDQYKSMMNDNYFGGTSSILVKKSLVDAIGGFDPGLPALQDWDLYIRLLRNGCGVRGIEEPLVKYYTLDPSKNVSCDFARYRAAASHMKYKFRDSRHYPLLRRRLAIIAVKRCVKSTHFLFSALRYYPTRLTAGKKAGKE